MLYETLMVTEYIPFCNDHLWPETSKIIEINLSYFTFSTLCTMINYLQRNGGMVAMGVLYVNYYMATTNDEIMGRRKNYQNATWHERNSALWQTVFGIVSCKCYHQFEWLDWLEFWAANDKKLAIWQQATSKMVKKVDANFLSHFFCCFRSYFFNYFE